VKRKRETEAAEDAPATKQARTTPIKTEDEDMRDTAVAWTKNRQDVGVWKHDTDDSDFRRPRDTAAQGLLNRLRHGKKAEKARTRGTTWEIREKRTLVRKETYHSDDPSLGKSKESSQSTTGCGVLLPLGQPTASLGRRPTSEKKRRTGPLAILLGGRQPRERGRSHRRTHTAISVTLHQRNLRRRSPGIGG